MDISEQWLAVRALVTDEAQPALEAAYRLAGEAHADQFRHGPPTEPRQPYLLHPLRVARICGEEWEQRDLATLQTCLMHDILEDCPLTQRRSFEKRLLAVAGPEVFRAIETLTKPAPAPAEVKDARDARYFSQLRNAPVWVRLVKCADRVDNLRDAKLWGDPAFWSRYSSETIGWHLFLARETAPIAEVALFKALVDGERAIRGRVPVWADGHLIDPYAASLVPEHIARLYHVIGLAVQGTALFLGLRDSSDIQTIEAVRLVTQKDIVPIAISQETIDDALTAGLFGTLGPA